MWPFRVEWAAGTLAEAPSASVAADAHVDVSPYLGGEPAGNYEDRHFDLASLSKVIAGSSLLVETYLQDARERSWDEYLAQPLSETVTELRGGPWAKTSLKSFWEHESGMPAHVLLFDPPRSKIIEGEDRAARLAEAAATIAGSAMGKAGTSVYSDLGYLLLNVFLERERDATIVELWRSWRRKHLNEAHSLRYFAELNPQERARIEPTESERHRPGEVNDDNCFSLGEASTHAGLVGSAREVFGWMQALRRWQSRESRVRNWLESPRRAGGRFVCGWDTPTPSAESGRSQAGVDAPATARGHLGYTGTALWFDPPSDRGGVLLTNRVYPRQNPVTQEIIRELRTEFFTALWQNEKLGQGQWFQKVQSQYPSQTIH